MKGQFLELWAGGSIGNGEAPVVAAAISLKEPETV